MELLWINCCISGKENSRTYKLSKEFLEKYKPEENLEVVEIDLSLQKLQPLKKEDIEKRDRLLNPAPSMTQYLTLPTDLDVQTTLSFLPLIGI